MVAGCEIGLRRGTNSALCMFTWIEDLKSSLSTTYATEPHIAVAVVSYCCASQLRDTPSRLGAVAYTASPVATRRSGRLIHGATVRGLLSYPRLDGACLSKLSREQNRKHEAAFALCA